MKQSLLIIAALAAGMALQGYAQQRQAWSGNNTVKQINTAGHSLAAKHLVSVLSESDNAPANAVEVPFVHNLGKENKDVVSNYTIINVNDDNRKWQVGAVSNYGACMVPNADNIDNNDDWLITVPIHMPAGDYIVSYEVGMMGSGATGVEMDVCIGTAPTVEAMTTTITPKTTFTIKDLTKYEYPCHIATEGYYYIGFHCTTPKDTKGTLKLTNIGVALNPIQAPEHAIEVPFVHDLGKSSPDLETVANYTIIDANGDERTWSYGKVAYASCMVPNAENINQADDWIITVPVHMTAGNYILRYDVGYLSGTGIQYEVKMGSAPTAEAMTTTIVPMYTETVKDMTTKEQPFTVDKEGYYYIGIHNTTSKDLKSAFKLNNIGVKEGSATPPVIVYPPAGGTLTYQLAPKGELKATLTYTAPTKDTNGDDLEVISKVILTSRWEVDKYTFENVQPGAVITQDVELYAGINNRFTAQAFNGDAAGEKIEYKSIFAGPDTPLAPENIKLTVSDDFMTATLSWDAVGEVGENGGYVDPAAVTYYIFDAFGSYYDPAIATTDKTSITFDYYSEIEGQDYYAYQVTAGYGNNYSLDGTSNVAVVGTPAALPFTESFANGFFDGLWISDFSLPSGQQQYGTIDDDYFASLFDPEDPDAPKPLASQDGDKGFHLWLPIEKDVQYGLISLRADISKATQPVLEFWYQGQGNVIDVFTGTDIADLQLAQTIDLKANPTSDWTLARVSLDKYKAAGGAIFEIRFTARDNDDEHTWSIPIDNIRVRNLDANDMHIVTFTGTKAAKVGDTATFTAHVENLGTEAATPKIVWSVDGTEYVTDSETVSPNAFADYTFSYTVSPLDAETLNVALDVKVNNDATPDDNTKTENLSVLRLPYATVTDLSATVDGTTVKLEWSAPVIGEAQAETVTDDFESPEYTPMSIDGAGGWTIYDGDGIKTYNVFREAYNPYQTAPMAFQLFDNIVAQVPSNYQADAEAHSGQRFMMAVSAQSKENDNWLISPELSGNAQTISFWAKSCMIAWPETFEVYYSTTDNKRESMTVKVENIEGTFIDGVVPEVWTEYKVTLPAGAKYFAIRHNSYDTLALFIDDVTYEASPTQPDDLAVDHYLVFCNGKQINQENVTTTTYTHNPFDQDTANGAYNFEYVVVPFYNYGAVLPSNTASVELAFSVIKQITVDQIAADTQVYNLAGVRVDHDKLTTGVYIIVNGTSAQKVMVK